MRKEEKKHIVTKIQKCDKEMKEDNIYIIICTIFTLASVFNITIAPSLLLIKILGSVFLSGSLFTIGYSIFDKVGLEKEKKRLINIIAFDKLKSSYNDDLDLLNIDKPNIK